MSPRDRILAAVRIGLGTARRAPEVIAAEAVALLADPDTIRPALSAPTPVEAFIIQTKALGTTLDRIADLAELPAAVARYLAEHGLRPAIAVEPATEFAALDWGDLTLHATLAPDEEVAVGLARWGIAEAGSLVIHSGPDTPILLAFLPLHHIVVLPTQRILAHLEDYATATAQTAPPRNAILITGPSGTTDIEGSYVRGAHGPGYLHVILLEDEPRPSP